MMVFKWVVSPPDVDHVSSLRSLRLDGTILSDETGVPRLFAYIYKNFSPEPISHSNSRRRDVTIDQRL